uniref:Uncharacterized protein n=1 Tax=Pristionchus pacificus TaxID=54126 RepID=A0A2A6B4D6_PRIPA|eukprot:PDM60728.1 hypothetical protein PRIPAC_54534 [Pristionchus pacificus]
MAKTEEKAESTGGVASMMLLGGSSRLDENWPGITENQGVWDEKLTGMKEYTSSIPRKGGVVGMKNSSLHCLG